MSISPSRMLINPRNRLVVRTAIEWLVLASWTFLLLHAYLNLDASTVPVGREYMTAIYGHFMWDDAKECGACAMWYGHARGGYPAFVDPHESMLHPIVIVSTLIWGTLNGAKIALVAFFFLAGLAQWWTARVMGLGSIACVWSGGMAIAAGNLAGRMAIGNFPLVVSAVSFAFLLPPLLLLCRNGSRRSAGMLGIALGLFIVSGQAYLQIGFAILAPFLLVLLVKSQFSLAHLLRRFGSALAVGLMTAAPFLVPFLHFSSSFAKFTDSSFAHIQPARYAPLNLVIGNVDFYKAEALGMEPYPYLYTIYIGWIAVGFAFVGFGAMWLHQQKRVALFFALFTVGAFFVSGATPFRWIRDLAEENSALHQFVTGIRHPTLISGLAVPVLLALAACGVDTIIRSHPHRLRFAAGRLHGRAPFLSHLRVDLRWLLAIPLIASLLSVREFGEHWLTVMSQPMSEITPVVELLKTEDLQWVDPPFGREYFVGHAIQSGLKLSTNVKVWRWNQRPDPVPVLAARTDGQPPDATLVATAGDIPIYRSTTALPYAHLRFDDGSTAACVAHGRGGNIDVTCESDRAGILVVQENHYSGWSARVNGSSKPVDKTEGQWLGVPVEAGQSVVKLRYRPWDVPLGIALMIVGVALAGVMIWKPGPAP